MLLRVQCDAISLVILWSCSHTVDRDRPLRCNTSSVDAPSPGNSKWTRELIEIATYCRVVNELRQMIDCNGQWSLVGGIGRNGGSDAGVLNKCVASNGTIISISCSTAHSSPNFAMQRMGLERVMLLMILAMAIYDDITHSLMSDWWCVSVGYFNSIMNVLNSLHAKWRHHVRAFCCQLPEKNNYNNYVLETNARHDTKCIGHELNYLDVYDMGCWKHCLRAETSSLFQSKTCLKYSRP